MKYKIDIKRSALKAMAKIPSEIAIKIRDKIRELSVNSRPAGCEKLTGQSNTWRIRVGQYRIIYKIMDEIIMIVVVNVDHRRDVYR